MSPCTLRAFRPAPAANTIRAPPAGLSPVARIAPGGSIVADSHRERRRPRTFPRSTSSARAPVLHGYLTRPLPRGAALPRPALKARPEALAGGGGDSGGGSGGSSGGGGGGGGEGDDRSPYGVPMGFPSLICLLHLFNKALICWCADPKFVDGIIPVMDVGMLGVMGGMAAIASFGGEGVTFLLPIIVEMGFAEMVLESVYNGVAVGKMRTEIWVHHIAAALSYGWVLKTGDVRLMRAAAMLTMTELSSAFPVAFNQARQGNKLNGARATALAVGMMLAFMVRTGYSGFLVFPVTRDVIFRGAAGAVTADTVAAMGGANCLVGLNAFWTYKIVKGALSFGKKSKKVAEGQ